MKLVNITNKEIKQIRNKMSRFDDDWIASTDTSFADDVWRAQRKMFYEILEKLEKAEEREK